MAIFDVNQIHHAIEQVPFFRVEYMADYAAFFNEHPTLTPERVVLYVNMGLQYDFYERIIYVADSYAYNVLINKSFRNAASFSPSDLVAVAPGHYLRQSAATAFLAMQADMEAAGLPIVPRSAYRSYQTQRELFDRNVANMGQAWADMWNARPGHSEHQLGLAIDVLHPGQAGVSLGAANFEQTPQYTWMLQNAHGFGFILSYPEAYTHITGYAYEPWHWRYVGEATATYMFTHGIPTLDHYWATRLPAEIAELASTAYIAPTNTGTDQITFIPPMQTVPLTAPPAETQVPSTLNPVLLTLGESELTLAHFLTPLLVVLIGLAVVARVIRLRRRRRRRLARQYDFASRQRQPQRTRQRGSGQRRAR